MFIRNCLTPRDEIVTVTPDTSLKDTLDLLQKHSLDSVPVVDDKGLFLGITGYRYIFKSLVEEGAQSLDILKNRKVSDALYLIGSAILYHIHILKSSEKLSNYSLTKL